MASQTDDLTTLFGWDIHEPLANSDLKTLNSRIEQVDTFVSVGTHKKFNKILKEWLKKASAHVKMETKRQEELSKAKDDEQSPSEDDESDFVEDSEDDDTLKRKLRRERREKERRSYTPSPEDQNKDGRRNAEEYDPTYTQKYVFERKLLDDKWKDSKVEDYPPNEIKNIARVSSVILQSAPNKKLFFKDGLKDLVHDGKLEPCLVNREELNKFQSTQLDELKGTTVTENFVDSCVGVLDGGSFGQQQYEILQTQFDLYANANSFMGKHKLFFQKLTKLTLEGWLAHKGNESLMLQQIRYATADEIERSDSVSNETSSSSSRGVQAMNSQQWSGEAKHKKDPFRVDSDGGDLRTPQSLRNTPLGGALIGLSNVATNDRLYWREWADSIASDMKMHLYNLNLYTFDLNQDALLSTNVLPAPTRHSIEIYAAGQDILYRFILSISKKLALKYPNLQPTVVIIEELASKPDSIALTCSKSKVVTPTVMTHYSDSVGFDIHIGVRALELLISAHYQTGLRKVVVAYSDLIRETIDLDKGLFVWYQQYLKDWRDLQSSDPFHTRGTQRDGNALGVYDKLEDGFFVLIFKANAEELRNQLLGTTNEVTFQLFYRELMQCNIIPDITTLIKKYHAEGSFQPTGKSTYTASGSNHQPSNSNSSSSRSAEELNTVSHRLSDHIKSTGLNPQDYMTNCGGVMILTQRLPPTIYSALPSEFKDLIPKLRRIGINHGLIQASIPLPIPQDREKESKKRNAHDMSSTSTLSSSSNEINYKKEHAKLASKLKKLEDEKAESVRRNNETKFVKPTAASTFNVAIAPPVPASTPTDSTTNSGGKGKGKGAGKGKGGKGKGRKGGKGDGANVNQAKGGKGNMPPPNAVPRETWELYNGEWYVKLSSGEWVKTSSPSDYYST